MSKPFDDNDEEDADMISLTLEDGTVMECEIITIFEVSGASYIALLPLETPDGFEEDEALIYRYIELENDECDLLAIEDEDEFERVADAFDEYLDEMEFNALPD